MVQINFAQRQVNAKIVFYGPGMSGKTTNLEIVHQRAPDANKGDLTSISTDGDRTLFFDFMPLDLGTVAGMKTSFQIYTVPGQVYYNSTRKLVLQGVDGVVFVADSSASMVEENLESLRNLEENLNEYGKSLATIAHVIQFNKRDLPDALSVDEMNAQLNKHNAPCFEAVANTGQGVFPTLKALAACVLESIHSSSGAGGAAPAPQQAPVQPMAQPQPQMAQPQMAQPQPQMAQPQMAPQQAPAPMAQPPQFQQPAVPLAPAAQAPAAPMQAPMPGMAQPQPAAPMARTNFQPVPGGGQQQPAMQAQPQPAMPQPMQQAQPVQQQQYAPPAAPMAQQQQMAQPQMAQPQGNLQLAPNQAPAAQSPGPMMAAPARPTRKPAPAPAPVPPPAAAPRSLDSTRFRPRSSRPEPRPTPAARGGGSKLFTGLFVVLALAVGAVLTFVVFNVL